jgi:hypothetical protein
MSSAFGYSVKKVIPDKTSITFHGIQGVFFNMMLTESVTGNSLRVIFPFSNLEKKCLWRMPKAKSIALNIVDFPEPHGP